MLRYGADEPKLCLTRLTKFANSISQTGEVFLKTKLQRKTNRQTVLVSLASGKANFSQIRGTYFSSFKVTASLQFVVLIAALPWLRRCLITRYFLVWTHGFDNFLNLGANNHFLIASILQFIILSHVFSVLT